MLFSSPRIADYFTHFAQTVFPINSTAEWPAHFPRAIPFPLMLFLPRSPSAATCTTPPGWTSRPARAMTAFLGLLSQSTATAPWTFSFHRIYQDFFYFKAIGNMGLIPGLGRSPRVGNGNPLGYSCLGNSKDRGAWWTTVHHGVAKSTTGVQRVGHDLVTKTTTTDGPKMIHFSFFLSSFSPHLKPISRLPIALNVKKNKNTEFQLKSNYFEIYAYLCWNF